MVFITGIETFFPNRGVANEEMEDFLGLIGDKSSRVKSIVLRQNGIKNRFYALDKKQNITHSNAQLAGEAILCLQKEFNCNDVQLLACATSTPDQLLPSHASMVHGYIKGNPMEIFSLAGVCLTSL